MTARRAAPPSTIHASYSSSAPVLPLWTQPQGSPLCDCSPIVNLQRAFRVDTYGPQAPIQDQLATVSDADSGPTATAAHHLCRPSTRLFASPTNGPFRSRKLSTNLIPQPFPSNKSSHVGPSSKLSSGPPPPLPPKLAWHQSLLCALSGQAWPAQ